jgi:hypothetical protein
MGLVRTNLTIPQETLDLVDAVAGPRGRSRYIADVVARQVRRDNARLVFAKYAGAFKGSTSWGRTDAKVDANLRALRVEWDERLDRVWETEAAGEVPTRHDPIDRPRPRPTGGPRSRRVVVQPGE